MSNNDIDLLASSDPAACRSICYIVRSSPLSQLVTLDELPDRSLEQIARGCVFLRQELGYVRDNHNFFTCSDSNGMVSVQRSSEERPLTAHYYRTKNHMQHARYSVKELGSWKKDCAKEERKRSKLSHGRVWFSREKVLMKFFWYFDHQLRVLNKV